MTRLERMTRSSMPAGSRSPAVRRSCSGSARVDIRRWLLREAYPLSSPRTRGPSSHCHRDGHWSLSNKPKLLGSRLRGDDSLNLYQAQVASLLRRQNLDQLALAGVDLGMPAVPADGDFLELDADLGVVVHHLAHLRVRERVQVSLPGVIGKPLAFLRHHEDRVELGGGRMLRVLGDREVIVA